MAKVTRLTKEKRCQRGSKPRSKVNSSKGVRVVGNLGEWCVRKYHGGWLINNGNFLLMVLESGSSRSRCWQIQCLVRATFCFTDRCLFALSSHGRRARELLGPFLKALISLTRAPSSWANYHSPIPSAPDTITLGVRISFSTWILEGDIQITAVWWVGM
jgi:hypothetical protein